jgi:hypothetical protein
LALFGYSVDELKSEGKWGKNGYLKDLQPACLPARPHVCERAGGQAGRIGILRKLPFSLTFPHFS